VLSVCPYRTWFAVPEQESGIPVIPTWRKGGKPVGCSFQTMFGMQNEFSRKKSTRLGFPPDLGASRNLLVGAIKEDQAADVKPGRLSMKS
jgi:hypothetical protein